MGGTLHRGRLTGHDTKLTPEAREGSHNRHNRRGFGGDGFGMGIY